MIVEVQRGTIERHRKELRAAMLAESEAENRDLGLSRELEESLARHEVVEGT
jgi:hypothetical protein